MMRTPPDSGVGSGREMERTFIRSHTDTGELSRCLVLKEEQS